MAKIAVFIDHDIMVRHFILNGVLSPIEDEHEVVFVFPENHKRVLIDLKALGLRRVRTIAVPNERTYLYKRLYHATVFMNMRHTETRHRQATQRIWRDLLGARAFWESWLYSWPLTYRLYKSLMLARLGENRNLNNLLREECPDVIVHPTVLEGLFVSDLVHWGEANGKPTVFIMNSWDNPATKAMMLGYPDRLVVWGEQTKRHAIRHMNVPPERIICLGAAQFDLYRRPPKEAPDEYKRRLGIPHKWKVLLYAGSSNGLNETSHLVRLEQAIEGGELKDCVVLYRPHPWRSYPVGEEDFYALKWNHVMLDPSMEACYQLSRNRSRMRVDLAQYEDTHTTLCAVDAVISPLSTILLEAALHGKPVAAYLPDEGMKRNQRLATRAQRVHFLEFFDRVDCIKCESPDHLIDDCRRLLQKTDEPGVGERLKEQCSYFIEPSDRPYAERINSLIHSLLSELRPILQEN